VPPDYNLFSLYAEYSQVLRAQGDLEKAAAVLAEGIQRVPHNSQVYLMCAQANLLFDEGRFAEMAELLDEAIDFAPQSSTPYANRACLHWMKKECDAARAQFEAGLETKPNVGAIIYYYYTAFLLQTEKVKQARQFIAQTYSLSPQSPEIDARLSVLSSVRPEDIWSIAPSTDDVQWQEIVS